MIPLTLLLALGVHSTPQAWGQTITHVWSQRTTESEGNFDWGWGISTDAAGNVAVSAQAGLEHRVVSYDSVGNVMWSRSTDVQGTSWPDVTHDPTGKVILVGDFWTEIDLGGGPLVPVGNADDIYLAKFDPSGDHLWSRRVGGPHLDTVWGVASDADENILITGYFRDSTDLGGGLLTAENYAIFVAKYDSHGDHIWSKSFAASGADLNEGVAIAADVGGDVLVTGDFSGAVDFGGGPLTSAGEGDVFAAKFDAAGGHIWSKRFGGPGDDFGLGVCVEKSSNCVVFTGTVQGEVDFGGGILGSDGQSSGYLLKISSSGDHLWSIQLGDSSVGVDVATVGSEKLAVTGWFTGATTLGGNALVSAGDEDIFLAIYNRDGSHFSTIGIGSTGDDRGLAIAGDPYKSILIAGRFTDTVDFGGGPLTSIGGRDAFTAKFTLSSPLDLEPDVINLASKGRWVTAYVEPAGFDPADIDISTVRLAGSIPAELKATEVGDRNRNGLSELMLKFNRQALHPLLTLGVNTLEVSGSLTTGGSFAYSDDVRVIDPRGVHPTASVAPNPLNPVGVLTLRTNRSGPVTVQMFDLQGRLVRTLMESRDLPAGHHEVRIDGRGDWGQTLTSGVYFYRAETAEGVAKGRVAILK